MGFVSFKNWCLILIFVLLTSYYVSAFRLIHPSQQTHESKKEKDQPEIKEHVKKVISLRDDIISHKESYRNQTFKLHVKSLKSMENENKIKKESSAATEKKIKILHPTVPLNITKDNLLSRAKTSKPLIKETKSENTVKENPTDEEKTKPIISKKELVQKILKTDAVKPKETQKTVTKEETVKKLDKIMEATKSKDKKTETVKEKEPEPKENIKAKPKQETAKVIDEKPVVKEKISKEIPKATNDKPKTKEVKEKPVIIKEKPVVTKEKLVVTKEKPVVKEKITIEVPKATNEQPKTSEVKEKIVIKEKQEEKSSAPTKKTEETLSKASNDNASPNFLYYNLPSFSPNFDILENEECKKQGQLLINELNNKKLWALKMFDSTAKIPSGILRGNLNQFGDYDQCVGIFVKISNDDKKESDVKIAGKYCLANIDFEAETKEMKLPVHLAQGRQLIRSKNQDPGHFIPRFTTMRWGICMPSGCSAQDAEKILEDSIRMYNESSDIGINFDVSVDADQCYVRKPPKKLLDYHYATIATLALGATICLIVFIATLRDVRVSEGDEGETKIEEPSKMEKVFMSFSLKRTMATLLRYEPEPDEIQCIHGIRAICTILLYIAHKLIPIGHMPFTNRTTLTELSNNPFSIILRLSVIYTDSFLLLSGILTSYQMSRDIEEKGHIPWFNRMIARFIRLTPALLTILLYYAYVMEILGEGPLWNTVITPNSKLCKDNWWKNVLYIQNVYPFQDMCATHTHQLALDMQLSMVAPILVWLLYRRPLMGVVTTILLHSISVILRYYTTLNYRLSLVIYHGISISQLYRTANMLYASSLHRATPYIAGVGLGVLLRQIKPNFSMPKILAIFGWLVAGYFASWALYTPSHLASRSYQYDINEAAQFSALCSLAWALALSWLIFACFAENEGYINSFLSSRPMVLFSRISYTLYLTQFIVFFYNVGSLRTATEFKINSSLDISEMVLVLVISTLLTLLVDIPMQKIKSVLLKSTASLAVEEETDVPIEHEESEDAPLEYENNIRKMSTDSQKSHDE